MSVIHPHAAEEATPQQYVFTITDGGFAKRTRIEEYRLQSRGGLGIKTMKQDDDRGNLVGGFIVVDGDEVLAIKQSGQVTRSAIDDSLRPLSRDTMGIRFVGVSAGDAVAVVARSVESALAEPAGDVVDGAVDGVSEPVLDADVERVDLDGSATLDEAAPAAGTPEELPAPADPDPTEGT
jgi:DNA gyrase subunit A